MALIIDQVVAYGPRNGTWYVWDSTNSTNLAEGCATRQQALIDAGLSPGKTSRKINNIHDLRLHLVAGIEWNKQKLKAMTSVGGPEFNSNYRCQGRIQGEIGCMEKLLQEIVEVK